jgi:hypothetical protein
MWSQRAYKTLAAKQCASCVFWQNLHLVRHQSDTNFTEISGLHIVKLLVVCKHAETTFFQIIT